MLIIRTSVIIPSHSMNYKALTIAYVSDAIYPYNKGGKEKRIYELSTRLAKQGYQVNIYTMNWWNNKHERKIENKVHLHGISKLYPLYSGERRSIRQAILFALSCFKLLREDFDIIDVDHMPHLVLFPLKIVTVLKRKKLLVTWNEVWGKAYWQQYLGKLGTIAYLIEYLSARMPDEIIAVSEHTKTKLIKDLRLKQTITVVPNGIDMSLIKSVKPAKQKSDVIFAGRLLSHKNVHILISAIHLLKPNYPNIKCVIIGKGPEEYALKQLTKNLKLEWNIIFYDFLKKDNDLYALMKASRVFAFPSTREGFGIVALEANAAGVPVVTTNHADNATKDLIKKRRNGDTIQLNKKKLAETIQYYLSNKTKTKDLIQLTSNYDWNYITKRVEEVYLR